MGVFCSTNSTWNSGWRLRSRVGLQLVDQPLEGQILVGVGLERGLSDPGEQLVEARVAGEVDAQASVLTKKPISPSSSAGVRLAIGVPITRSVWLAIAGEQHAEGRQQGHEGRGVQAPAKPGQARAQVVRQWRAQGRAAVALDLWARRSVGRSSAWGAPVSWPRQ